jgi:PAS domain S-box-containing protein
MSQSVRQTPGSEEEDEMKTENDAVHKLLSNLPGAYSCHKIVKDKNRKAVDSVILDVNPSFEKLTGFSSKELIGKTMTELYPAIKNDPYDWFGTFSLASMMGRRIRFDQLFTATQQWFDVTVFSDKPGYFEMIWLDITDRVEEHASLSKIVEFSEGFLQSFDRPLNCQQIADTFRDMTGAKIAAYHVYDDAGERFKTVALSGNKEIIRKASALGLNISGRQWDHDPIRMNKIKAKTITRFATVKDLSGSVLSRPVIILAEKLFSLGEAVVIKIIKDHMILGDFTLIMPKGVPFKDDAIAEVYTRQLGLAMIQKKTEQQLKTERERLANILDGTRVGTWEWNVQTGNTLFYEGWEEITGHQLNNESSHNLETWISLIHPDDLEMRKQALARVFSREEAYYNVEYRMRHKDDRWIWVQSRGKVASWTPDGKPVRMCGTHMDITARKEAELALKASESKHRRLFETMAQGVLYQSADGRIISANPAAEKILGYSFKQLSRKTSNDSDWEAVKEDGSPFPGHDHPSMVALRTGRQVGPLVMGVVHPVSKKYTWLLITAIPLFESGGTMPNQVYTTFSDITEKRHAELKLIAEKEKAEAATRAKTQFLANMSHELRTPMNGFMGMIQLLEMTEMSEEQQEYVRYAMHASESLLQVVNDILEFTKLDADKIHLETEFLNLEKMAQEIFRVFKAATLQKKINMQLIADPLLPQSVIGDAFRVRQVLINLLGNAVKFTDEGSVTLRISQKGYVSPEKVRILFEVEDTGIGIPPDQIDKVFDRFYMGDDSDSRKYGGTGLGLSISKALVELMNGKIWVESTPGMGSTFFFECVFERDPGAAQQVGVYF